MIKSTLLKLFLLLFVASCTTDSDLSEGEKVPVNFSLPGITAEATQQPVTRASMQAGTTVRVVAYRSGDLGNTGYVAEKAYTVQADGTLAPTDGTPLRLIMGTYDFYAVTPALAVNHAGSAPTVSVGHLADFASKLVSGQSVAQGSGGQSITLGDLERKCSQLALQLNAGGTVVNNQPVTKVAITEAVFTQMTAAPQTLTATDDFPAGVACTDAITAGASCFATDGTQPTLSSGGCVALPKQAGSFGLKLKALFNDAHSLEFDKANIANLEFKKGYRYAFVATYDNDKFRLSLVVAPWTTEDINTDLGSGSARIYPLGQWTLSTIEGSWGAGGFRIRVSGWQASHWSGNLGEGGATIGTGGWTSTEAVNGVLGAGGVNIGSGNWNNSDQSGSVGGGGSNMDSGNWNNSGQSGSVGGGGSNMGSGNWNSSDINFAVGE